MRATTEKEQVKNWTKMIGSDQSDIFPVWPNFNYSRPITMRHFSSQYHSTNIQYVKHQARKNLTKSVHVVSNWRADKVYAPTI